MTFRGRSDEATYPPTAVHLGNLRIVPKPAEASAAEPVPIHVLEAICHLAYVCPTVSAYRHRSLEVLSRLVPSDATLVERARIEGIVALEHAASRGGGAIVGRTRDGGSVLAACPNVRGRIVAALVLTRRT